MIFLNSSHSAYTILMKQASKKNKRKQTLRTQSERTACLWSPALDVNYTLNPSLCARSWLFQHTRACGDILWRTENTFHTCWIQDCTEVETSNSFLARLRFGASMHQQFDHDESHSYRLQKCHQVIKLAILVRRQFLAPLEKLYHFKSFEGPSSIFAVQFT